MVCFDEMDPDKAVVLVTFEGGASAYSDDLNNVAFSHRNGLVATSRCANATAYCTRTRIQLYRFNFYLEDTMSTVDPGCVVAFSSRMEIIKSLQQTRGKSFPRLTLSSVG